MYGGLKQLISIPVQKWRLHYLFNGLFCGGVQKGKTTLADNANEECAPNRASSHKRERGTRAATSEERQLGVYGEKASALCRPACVLRPRDVRDSTVPIDCYDYERETSRNTYSLRARRRETRIDTINNPGIGSAKAKTILLKPERWGATNKHTASVDIRGTAVTEEAPTRLCAYPPLLREEEYERSRRKQVENAWNNIRAEYRGRVKQFGCPITRRRNYEREGNDGTSNRSTSSGVKRSDSSTLFCYLRRFRTMKFAPKVAGPAFRPAPRTARKALKQPSLSPSRTYANATEGEARERLRRDGMPRRSPPVPYRAVQSQATATASNAQARTSDEPRSRFVGAALAEVRREEHAEAHRGCRTPTQGRGGKDWQSGKTDNFIDIVTTRSSIRSPSCEEGWKLVVPSRANELMYDCPHDITPARVTWASKKLRPSKARLLTGEGMYVTAVFEYVRTCTMNASDIKISQNGPQGLQGRRVIERPWVGTSRAIEGSRR
ncbi:unnamed protein product [Trichogramma brassicae]|uniref:Uncharacterized protein n=1 Tax=Trichogramma brassicae TaxID=86971 RepID=A0A6H5HZF2_9HYME|nr:unnamed protein product [Trichogramma brassicae]